MSRPEYGTSPIRCGKTKCKWRGFETDLREVHTARWTQKVCPTCGCESYSFMTPKEIAARERNKTKAPSSMQELRDRSPEPTHGCGHMQGRGAA